MKNYFTKALSLLLCAFMLTGILSTGVFAVEDNINVTNLYDYTKAEQYGSHIWHRYSEFIEVTAATRSTWVPASLIRASTFPASTPPKPTLTRTSRAPI